MKNLLKGSSRKCRCACPVFYFNNDHFLGVNLPFCLPQSSNDALAWKQEIHVIQEIQAHLPPPMFASGDTKALCGYNFPLLATSSDSGKWQFAR